MSDNKKKALLNEVTTKRFWKLAGLRPIHEKAYVFEEDEDLDEGMRSKKEDEEGRKKKMEESDLEERFKKEDEEGRKKKMEEDSDLEERAKKEDDVDEGMMRGKKQDEEGRKKKMEESEELEEMGGMMPGDEDEPDMDMGDEGPEGGQDVEVDVPEGDVASLRTARDIIDQILSAVEGGGDDDMGDDMGDDMDDEDDDPLAEVDQEELEEVAERIASRVAKRISESLKKN